MENTSLFRRYINKKPRESQTKLKLLPFPLPLLYLKWKRIYSIPEDKSLKDFPQDSGAKGLVCDTDERTSAGSSSKVPSQL